MIVYTTMIFLLGISLTSLIAQQISNISTAKGIAMKSSGNLPGCTFGRIAYTVETKVDSLLKTTVFRITEAISADECAHLCHTHYFCRSAGFEPNSRVESGGLCYLSYKDSQKCVGDDVQRVTDYQTIDTVWLDCDQCVDPLLNIKTAINVQVIDEETKLDGENVVEKMETPVPEPELNDFNNNAQEGSGSD